MDHGTLTGGDPMTTLDPLSPAAEFDSALPSFVCPVCGIDELELLSDPGGEAVLVWCAGCVASYKAVLNGGRLVVEPANGWWPRRLRLGLGHALTVSEFQALKFQRDLGLGILDEFFDPSAMEIESWGRNE
jgi:hypothetical protein